MGAYSVGSHANPGTVAHRAAQATGSRVTSSGKHHRHKPVGGSGHLWYHYLMTITPCSFDGCGNNARKIGLCVSHYGQHRRGVVLREIRPYRSSSTITHRGDGTAVVQLCGMRGEQVAEAIIDVQDIEAVSGKRWTRSQSVATSYVYWRDQKETVYLHRWLTEAPSGAEVDHINGNGLDNRRENLRIVTRRENRQNVAYRGREHLRNVKFDGRPNAKLHPWRAQIQCNGKRYERGPFATSDEAIAAAQALRAEHMPFVSPSRHDGRDRPYPPQAV